MTIGDKRWCGSDEVHVMVHQISENDSHGLRKTIVHNKTVNRCREQSEVRLIPSPNLVAKGLLQ